MQISLSFIINLINILINYLTYITTMFKKRDPNQVTCDLRNPEELPSLDSVKLASNKSPAISRLPHLVESLIEKNIIESPIYIIMGEYLNISDNINLFTSIKKICKNSINIEYSFFLIKKKAITIIKRTIKKYITLKRTIINYFDTLVRSTLITRRSLAIYYFVKYKKIHINGFYNFDNDIKINIINKYKDKITDNPSRLDLFNLIKKMNIHDVYYIGW